MADMYKYSMITLLINSLASALCFKHLYLSLVKKFEMRQEQTVDSLHSKIVHLQNEIQNLKADVERKNKEIDELKRSHNAVIDNFVNRSYEVL